MKTSIKGVVAVIVFLISIFIYYWLSKGIDSFWSNFCAKNYCMKTPSLAEFLAIEMAAIGVYFVVSSIDDWKKADQYQTAKNNIKLLHEIYQKLLEYNVQLAQLDQRRFGLIVPIGNKVDQHTRFFYTYESWLNKLNIMEIIKNADNSITQQHINYRQKDFDSLIKLASDYVNNINSEILKKDAELIQIQNENIKDIKANYDATVTNNNNHLKLEDVMQKYIDDCQPYIQNLTQNDIDMIHTKEHEKFDKFEKALRELQNKLNNFIQ